MSVLLISKLSCQIPDFTLEQEGIYDKLLQSFGYKDINFDKFPVFSDKYLLKGNDEQKIRTFFEDELIVFFEQNQGFALEVKENKSLIYKSKKLVEAEEAEEIFSFGEKLIQILSTKSTEIKTV